MRRILSALAVGGATVALCLVAPPALLAAAILAAAGLAAREAARLAGAILERPPSFGRPLTLVLVLLFASQGFPWPVVREATPALLLLAAAVLAMFLPRSRRGFAWLGAALAIAIWIGLPAAALLALALRPGGGPAVLFLLGVVMVGEAAALALGRLIRGPRLSPLLSPGKTWAGLISQLTAGAAVGALLGPELLAASPGPAVGALAGAVLSAVAALGDLFASYWKRSAGAKDTGRSIPGHGGMLDLVDGALFAAVAWPGLARLLAL